jgi:hypothetical protein
MVLGYLLEDSLRAWSLKAAAAAAAVTLQMSTVPGETATAAAQKLLVTGHLVVMFSK